MGQLDRPWYRNLARRVGITVAAVLMAAPAAVSTRHLPAAACGAGSCPIVNSVSPDAAAVGATVTITGQGFDASTSVSFGATSTAAPTVDPSGTSLTVVVPQPGTLPASGVVDVAVVTSSGTSPVSTADLFAYGAAEAFSASPSGAPLGSGIQVTVSGLGFVPGVAVSAGNTIVAPSDVTVQSATSLLAVLPGSAKPIQVRVMVSNALGGSSKATFTYGPATISDISSHDGPSAGGQRVDIAVQNFADEGVSVSFGGRPAAVLGYDAFSKVVTVTTPSYPTTTVVEVTVTVATVGGTSNALTYTYWPPPTVTQVAPAVAPRGCTAWVAIHGSNFAPGGATSVFFGSPRVDRYNVAAETISVSRSTILATTPCTTTVRGLVHVIVVSTGGQSQPSLGSLFLLL